MREIALQFERPSNLQTNPTHRTADGIEVNKL